VGIFGYDAALAADIRAYQIYERDDRKLRALAVKNRAAAVAYDIGTAPGQSDWAFSRYSAALLVVLALAGVRPRLAGHDELPQGPGGVSRPRRRLIGGEPVVRGTAACGALARRYQ
jgi:hypothetical protein